MIAMSKRGEAPVWPMDEDLEEQHQLGDDPNSIIEDDDDDDDFDIASVSFTVENPIIDSQLPGCLRNSR
jgi:hypothetical protein